MNQPPLREFQKNAIQSALLNTSQHLIVHSATGSGKSRIFQELAAVHRRRLVLVSPLVALSRQHQKKFSELGVAVAMWTAGSREKPNSETRVWLLSPETLVYARKRKDILWRPDFLVVDECHTLWEWGSSFRPPILEIPKALEDFRISKSIWLSATMPVSALEQLQGLLGPSTEVQGRFGLPELLDLNCLQLPWSDRLEFLRDWAIDLGVRGAQGVLFAPTRSLAERFYRMFAGCGISSLCYHAGFSSEERSAIESAFRNQAGVSVLVATSAFGMGMDFPGLTEAVLWQPPRTLLSLAQAIGRVARANQAGRAWIFWNEDDLSAALTPDSDPVAVREVFAYLRGTKDGICPKVSLQSYFRARSV